MINEMGMGLARRVLNSQTFSLRGIDWTFREMLWRYLAPDAIRPQTTNFDQLQARSLDLAAVPGMYDPAANRPHQRGHLSVRIVEDVVLWPSYGGGCTPDGALIMDSFHSPQKVDAGLRQHVFKPFPTRRIDETVATLGHFNRNYYHKFADSVPRLYSLWHPELRALDRILLLIDRRFTADERRLIESLVPPNVEIVKLGYLSRVSPRRYVHLPFMGADRVQHSEWFYESAGYLPQEYLTWYRERVFDHFGIRNPQPRHKLFISRRNARIRRTLNEDEVAIALEQRGFRTVQLESLSLADQVRLLAEAQCVVGQHGAGLTNILYMSPGARVVELLSTPDQLIHYSLLSENLGIEHVQLVHHEARKNADITVNVEKLLAAVRG